MALNQLQLKILKPFVDETIKSLELMVGVSATDISVGEPFVDDVSSFKFKGYAVAAQTFGNIDGYIIMHHYMETALGIGNKVRENMLGEEEQLEEMTEDMGDALAEWGNTAIGRAMNDLNKFDLGIRFNPPYFINNLKEMDTLLSGVKEIITIPINIESMGRFYFNYLLHSETNLLGSNAKIMVVDDMKMIRTSLKRYLKQLGYENVIEAQNGLEAIALHEKEKPDMIFMDVVMPEVTGDEALKQIRSKDSATPIVMLSSVSDDNVIDECRKLGIAGYVVKPLTKEMGPEMLKEYLKTA